ncbi:MAG: CPBP family glutamic-type intramembrane protease [Candidatus Methanomethyliaceae archaeon]
MVKRSFHWRAFLALWLASLVGIFAVLPASLTLQSPLLSKVELPIAFELLLALQVGQNAVLFAIATALGLMLAQRVGLGVPLLDAFFAGKDVKSQARAILLPSSGLGTLVALAIATLDSLIFVPVLKMELGDLAQPLTPTGVALPAWQGLLGSLYGGINEEIFFRLFFLSLFAFLGKRVHRTTDRRPALGVLWVANILAALLYGLGHLPNLAMIVPLSAGVIMRIVLLNGLAGIVFGYLYFTRGLEAAILSHFTADVFLHVLLPLVV